MDRAQQQKRGPPASFVQPPNLPAYLPTTYYPLHWSVWWLHFKPFFLFFSPLPTGLDRPHAPSLSNCELAGLQLRLLLHLHSAGSRTAEQTTLSPRTRICSSPRRGGH